LASVLIIALLAIATAGFFALDRYRTWKIFRARSEALQGQLQKAVKLVQEHPRAFGSRGGTHAADTASLKNFAQETSTKLNITLGYLSENERVAGKGGRERQVIVRLVNAGHSNLVRFLEEMERVGGARVKELHLRPSREISDGYEEAEIVFSKISAPEGPP
jgi:hypothetical protein